MGTIKFDKAGFIINGKREVLHGGEFQYFRILSSEWDDRLRKMKQSGANFLSTYIPWSWHEPVEGQYDWTSPERDVRRFLDLCKKNGLYVVIKPGPYICAEWDFGGYPHWFYEKDVVFRTGEKNYMALTKTWFSACAEVIRPYLITKGEGPIILMQVENEYDHLCKYHPEITGSKEDARKYVTTLLQYGRDDGLDVPVFSNDCESIIGTEIINCNTYYPNIPWFTWWRNDFYEEQMETNLREQPDKPLMVLEAQAGWFNKHGYPIVPFELPSFEMATKSITAFGTSLINYYMFAGGSTWPYWGSKGDGGGIGMTTTYDFSGVPIREWGETHEDKYGSFKLWAYFLASYPQIVTEATLSYDAVKLVSGASHLSALYKEKSSINADFKDTYQGLFALARLGKDYSSALIRNLGDDQQSLTAKFTSTTLGKEITFPASGPLDLEPHTATFLPIDFTLSGDHKIIWSVSEVGFKKDIGGRTHVILHGPKARPGQTLIVSSQAPKLLAGEVKQEKTSDGWLLSYRHDQEAAFQVGEVVVLVYETFAAYKLWQQPDFLMQSDVYHLDHVKQSGTTTTLGLQIKAGKAQKTSLIASKKIKKISLAGEPIPFKPLKGIDGGVSFQLDQAPVQAAKAEWTSNWKYQYDSAESLSGYDDTSWGSIAADKPLELDKHYEHGFYWYRWAFDVQGNVESLFLDFKTNNYDRYLVYLNGELILTHNRSYWIDIGKKIKQGKNHVAVMYVYEWHTKAHPHEGPIKKISGLYLPVCVRGVIDGKDHKEEFKSYKMRPFLGGDLAKFQSPDFDDSKWPQAAPNKKYIIQEDLGIFAWFRREFSFSKKEGWEAPLLLRIKKLKERSLFFVNGHACGRSENVGPQVDFYIPAQWLKEQNNFTMLIEGPGYGDRHLGYKPAWFEELEFDFYYNARHIDIVLETE